MNLFKSKIAKFLVKLIISLTFITWLILKINWQDVLAHCRQLTVVSIVVYLVILLIGMVISAYKWQLLAEFKDFNYSLKKYFQLYLTGTFLNNFFPSFIGGDTYRAYQLGKKNGRYVSATASVVMDRVTGLLGAMILAVFFAAFNWKVVAAHRVLVIIIGIVILVLMGLFVGELIANLPIWKKLSRFIPKKVSEVIKDFAQYQGSKAFSTSIAIGVLYSFVGLACVNYALFWALGIKIGILNYLTVIFLISIVSSIPVSVNNLGIKEWAYVTFFGFFGVASSAVVTVALVSRILQMLVSFAALPMYLNSRKNIDK
ncbi:MAG: lysylphosphatidylglycerol synthase transmembrane domain-containing protein [Candidatus Moraniibacteriota bacterium]